MPKFTERLKNGWNAFVNNKDPSVEYFNYGGGSSFRPDRVRLTRGNDRTIITSIYNRIATDVAAVSLEHVRTDENEQYVETIDSTLNECLTVSANLDQTGRNLLQDAVLSMFDEGVVAIVPVETDTNPDASGSYDILSLRTAKILTWYPYHVRVDMYNELKGRREQIVLPKDTIAIVENPFYAVMNEPNSILRRLIYKFNLLDVIDEQTSSGKLDLIIQLPYVIKTEGKKIQAENRRKQIEAQLTGSKYGIAYTDGTERITQLNRAVENHLLDQIEYLTSMLYSQLGLTAEIMNGTADEKTMLNYTSRTIEPIISSISEEMTRKFLTQTARSQNQRIKYFRDPFKLVPINDLANMADVFTRNEILTSNEIRGIIGYKPVDSERANSLLNKNINTFENEEAAASADEGLTEEEYQAQMAALDENDRELDELEAMLQSDLNDPSEFLAHYASKYYDPQKAHEYYEAHKKLKGRRSTAKLNDKGKEVWTNVKQNLTSEKKTKRENAAAVTKDRIATLREQLKSLGKTGKDDAVKERFANKIQALRDQNASYRERLKEIYEQKFDEEYDRIASTNEFVKTKKK